MMKLKTTITNPMTVIAIFATLSETSAAISLPFLDNEARQTYIWFLISFPFYLILLFFITLNFNYRSLYAPSDFEKGRHFIKVMDNDRLKHGSSKTITGEQRHQRPDIIEDPPEPHCARIYPCTRQLVRLPAPFTDLHIIDTRGKNRKIDLDDICEKYQREKSETARVIVFLTGRAPEKLLKSCVPKLAENAKRRCSSVFCVAYNVISHEMMAWPSATEEPVQAQQE